MAQEFKQLQRIYSFNIIDGYRSVAEISAELRKKIGAVLSGDQLD